MQDNIFEDLCDANTYQKITVDAQTEKVIEFKRKIIYDISYTAKTGKNCVSFQVPVAITDSQINNIVQELRDKGFKIRYSYWADYELTVSW